MLPVFTSYTAVFVREFSQLPTPLPRQKIPFWKRIQAPIVNHSKGAYKKVLVGAALGRNPHTSDVYRQFPRKLFETDSAYCECDSCQLSYVENL